jgi:hypothetical protein
MERNELAARFLPSFIYPTTSNEQDRTLALDKAYQMADAYLERAKREPNTMLVALSFETEGIISGCCHPMGKVEFPAGKQEQPEHVYSGDVYIDGLMEELRHLYIGLDASEKTITNKGQVLRLVERFTVPPGAERDGNDHQTNNVGRVVNEPSGLTRSVRGE